MVRIDYNQRAVDLAKQLLGKKICYGNKEYMITVTEAYPYDEEDKTISYVNRHKNGKGHEYLTGKDKIGNCFVYGGMLHIACAGGNSTVWENEYSCDNILIRGAMLIENDSLKEENERLNYEIGSPYTLCQNKLNIDSSLPAVKLGVNKLIQIKEYKSNEFSDNYIIKGTRYNIKNNKNEYKYYLSRDKLKELL